MANPNETLPAAGESEPDNLPQARQAGTARPEDDHHDKGNTRVMQSHGAVPRMPHERDESVDSQPGQSPTKTAMTDAATKDAQSGMPDTSRAAVMDKVYNEKVRPDDNDAR